MPGLKVGSATTRRAAGEVDAAIILSRKPKWEAWSAGRTANGDRVDNRYGTPRAPVETRCRPARTAVRHRCRARSNAGKARDDVVRVFSCAVSRRLENGITPGRGFRRGDSGRMSRATHDSATGRNTHIVVNHNVEDASTKGSRSQGRGISATPHLPDRVRSKLQIHWKIPTLPFVSLRAAGRAGTPFRNCSSAPILTRDPGACRRFWGGRGRSCGTRVIRSCLGARAAPALRGPVLRHECPYGVRADCTPSVRAVGIMSWNIGSANAVSSWVSTSRDA